ncbi:unnamed protein product [Lampetra planeri]
MGKKKKKNGPPSAHCLMSSTSACCAAGRRDFSCFRFPSPGLAVIIRCAPPPSPALIAVFFRRKTLGRCTRERAANSGVVGLVQRGCNGETCQLIIVVVACTFRGHDSPDTSG